MSSTARVGIVIPTLGERLDWLTEAVDSAQRQSAEVSTVVVAPASVVVTLRDLLPGVAVEPERATGIVAAIETGWSMLADCEFLGWLGDDDALTRGSVAAALACLASAGGEMVYGDYEYIDVSGRRVLRFNPGRLAPLLLRLGQNFIAQPGCLYSREAIEQAGGIPPGFRFAFDAALHLKLARHAVYCPTLLSTVRVHPGRLTMTERRASLAELHRAVDLTPERLVLRLVRRRRFLCGLAGRVYFKLRRTYADAPTGVLESAVTRS